MFWKLVVLCANKANSILKFSIVVANFPRIPSYCWRVALEYFFHFFWSRQLKAKYGEFYKFSTAIKERWNVAVSSGIKPLGIMNNQQRENISITTLDKVV